MLSCTKYVLLCLLGDTTKYLYTCILLYVDTKNKTEHFLFLRLMEATRVCRYSVYYI